LPKKSKFFGNLPWKIEIFCEITWKKIKIRTQSIASICHRWQEEPISGVNLVGNVGGSWIRVKKNSIFKTKKISKNFNFFRQFHKTKSIWRRWLALLASDDICYYACNWLCTNITCYI